ncbi:MAG: hypothetical protein FJX02_10990 [Alphaproteobacteria bacterium]|nr:hypothetical protein [Alphaproteobacteria bacterium]
MRALRWVAVAFVAASVVSGGQAFAQLSAGCSFINGRSTAVSAVGAWIFNDAGPHPYNAGEIVTGTVVTSTGGTFSMSGAGITNAGIAMPGATSITIPTSGNHN